MAYGFESITADAPETGYWIAYDNRLALIPYMPHETIRGEVGEVRSDCLDVLWTTGDSDTIATPSFEILAVSHNPPIM